MGTRCCRACCVTCCPDCIHDESRAFDSPFVDDRDSPEVWDDIPLEERGGDDAEAGGDEGADDRPQEQIHTITTD
jgi:hypothetical protein